ncbi:MAG TPA: ATP-binding protein [Phycisphaerae bacterium]|nr:ATP-binding protein [Phycisphaerae bacterium]
MYYPRALEYSFQAAASQFPIVLLTGPRQVGKTTLLQHLAKSRRGYVTLDDPAVRVLAQSDPALFLQRYEPPVMIDEIQYAPQLLPHIKMHVDRKREPGAFWLTGSQHFHLMKNVSETLAGRVAILSLLGFTTRERRRRNVHVDPFLPTPEALATRGTEAPKLTLKRVFEDIWLGTFPVLVTKRVRDRDLFYSSYLQTYLQRDVKDLAQVGNEATFLRFLTACAARTGQMLNLTDLARDADIAVNTAKNWLSVLQASFQITLLQPYHTNITKRLVKTPKLYFLDTGLCAYLTRWSDPATLESGAMGGTLLETYVVAEVLKSWWNQGKQAALYYLRTKDGYEIDLLLQQDRHVYPVEIKKAASPRREWAQAFDSLNTLKLDWPAGAVVCLRRDALPLSDKVTATPVGTV